MTKDTVQRVRLTFDSSDPGDGTPRTGDYIARLDKKTGHRVLCGAPNGICRGQLADIRGPGRNNHRQLVMAPGWRPSVRGVWSDIKWLETRRKAGYDRPRTRRGFVLNSTDAETGEKDTRAHQIGAFVRLPAIAVCPICKHRNVLDADELRVVPDEYSLRAADDHIQHLSLQRLLESRRRRHLANHRATRTDDNENTA